MVNNLACKGLDRIEKTLPILHQPSEQVGTWSGASRLLSWCDHQMSVHLCRFTVYTTSWLYFLWSDCLQCQGCGNYGQRRSNGQSVWGQGHRLGHPEHRSGEDAWSGAGRDGEDPRNRQRERQHSAGEQGGPAGQQRCRLGPEHLWELGGAIPTTGWGRAW